MAASFYDLSDVTIAGILIGSGFAFAFMFCIGVCSIFYGINRRRNGKKRFSKQSSSFDLIKEQSESVVRGDHPIAFVLPTVSLSETGSEFSDMASEFSSSTTSFSMPEDPRFHHQMHPNPCQNRRTSMARIHGNYNTAFSDEDEMAENRLRRSKKYTKTRKLRQVKRPKHPWIQLKRPRTISCGTLTFHWKQSFDKNTLKLKVSHVEMGPEFVGYFVKFQLSLNDESHQQQEIEAHFEDLANSEFMGIFREFYWDSNSEGMNLFLRAQNLRRTLTFEGKLELLSLEPGNFTQIVNMFLSNVRLFLTIFETF